LKRFVGKDGAVEVIEDYSARTKTEFGCRSVICIRIVGSIFRVLCDEIWILASKTILEMKVCVVIGQYGPFVVGGHSGCPRRDWQPIPERDQIDVV